MTDLPEIDRLSLKPNQSAGKTPVSEHTSSGSGTPVTPGRVPQLPPLSTSHIHMNEDIQARLLAFQQKRTKAPPIPTERSQSANDVGDKATIPSPSAAEQYRKPAEKQTLSQRRGLALNIGDIASGTTSPETLSSPSLSPPSQMNEGAPPLSTTGELGRRLSERRKKPNFKLRLDQPSSNLANGVELKLAAAEEVSDKKPQLQGLFANYSKYVDIKLGSLNFAGKASLHSKGINFLSGSSFHISLDQLEFLEELGHGNYGTVRKVLHKPTGVLMAMKEVRLELDESKFTQILMELEILHKCDSPYIVDFYGAFFVEGAVYMCIEYMDGNSLDNVYSKDEGIHDEACLAYITECIIRGLKDLKDKHNIIHRDVKPTNILINTHGKVKLCDFGVLGNLVASLAKTNIGCQSYMAPERIKSLKPDDGTYSVQLDVWLLGLSILEIACGMYPYPPETYDNIFSQLSAIVEGEPPRLDPKIFSAEAQQFVRLCLNKNPDLRPSYDNLLEHPWLVKYRNVDCHMAEYVTKRLAENAKSKTDAPAPEKAGPKGPKGAEDVRTLLKNKVRAPALHRGGLPAARR